MDADGTKDGFDLELIRLVRARLSRAGHRQRGSRGRPTTSRRRCAAGADAVLAASVFHFGDLTVSQVKAAMREAGVTVR